MDAPLKVLIVEDNPLDAELVLRELRHAGFDPVARRVDQEPDYREGLRGDVDIVLSDFELPQFDGLRALEILRESGRDLPFILISGTIGEDLAVTAMQLGAADYLMKDRLGRLGPAIRHAINQKRLEREARRVAEAVRENAAFINEVLNSLSAAVVVLDSEGGIRATNQAWDRFAEEFGGPQGRGTNYLAECMAGPAALEAEDAQAVRTGIAELLRGERREFVREYACHGAAGQRWFQMRVTPLGGGNPGAVVVHERITEIKLAEQSLRQSEERFRGLIENVTDLIVVVNQAGVIEFTSPAAKPSLGYEPAEVTGRSVIEFIHEEDQDIALQALQRAREGSLPARSVEIQVRHHDGSWRTFQSVGTRMRGLAGEPLVVINSRDVTETRQLETQFLRAQRLEAIGTLSSGIAHDLNNILAPMLMVAPLLRDKLTDPQDAELLTMIEHGAQRGASIIRQLLTFSRGVEGKRLPVQLRYLLKEMMTIMRETFPREILVLDQVAADLWPVTADTTQMHQVLLNLCVNARDAMSGGGTLSLAGENIVLTDEAADRLAPLKPGPYVCLAVSDTGEGIARENLHRIFEPFFTTKEIGKGTGLGLSTVLGIVKSHGGLVTVDSEVGAGTTFKVFLPVLDGVPEPSTEPTLTTLRGDNELLLIVDDEMSVRRALRLRLEENNYRVLEAQDGRSALERFLAHREEVRLVLTDVMMPGMDGVALTRALRALAPRLPIIATSGLHDPARQEELAAMGVTRFITKPCAATDILTAIQAELVVPVAS